MTQRKVKVFGKTRIWLVVLLLFFGIVTADAQQGGTTQYFYDDNGRLYAVVAPNGETALYEYDAAGNILVVRRLPAGTLTLFSFNPHEGVPGDQVIFLGSGFVAGQTAVFFNGATAQITESTTTRIAAVVPDGATTGRVTISTPNGSVITPTPFIIRGIKITPNSARIYFGDALQMTATVYSQVLNSAVRWSVGGTDGDATVGVITANGLYTAPQRAGAFIVRATLIEDPTIFAESQIEVRDPNNLQTIFNAVSVRRGRANISASVSSAVSVRRGVANVDAAVSSSVSVRKGLTLTSNTIATGVSVRRGLSDTILGTSSSVSVSYGSALRRESPQSGGVSVRFGAPSEVSGARSSVSVSNAPVVTGIAPASARRGLTTGITITGNNLNDVAKLIFINSATGEIVTNITVSNITASADGKSVTANLTIPSTMSLIKLVIVAATTDKTSQSTDTGGNTVQIIQ